MKTFCSREDNWREKVRLSDTDIPPRASVCFTPPTVSTHYTSSLVERKAWEEALLKPDNFKMTGSSAVQSSLSTARGTFKPFGWGLFGKVILKLSDVSSCCCWCLGLTTCWNRFSFWSGGFLKVLCEMLGCYKQTCAIMRPWEERRS